jgi:hypothetical protein
MTAAAAAPVVVVVVVVVATGAVNAAVGSFCLSTTSLSPSGL